MKARKQTKSPAKKRSRPTFPNAPFDRISNKYNEAPSGPMKTVPWPKGAPPDAFGLQVTGDCLAPRVRDGQVVIVERAVPTPGELAVLWFKGAGGPVVKILCNEIVGYPLHPESECIPLFNIEQTNPPKRFQCRMDKVDCIARVHSIVG